MIRRLLDGATHATALMPWGSPGPIRLPEDEAGRTRLVVAHLAGAPAEVEYEPEGKPPRTVRVDRLVMSALCPAADGLARWLGDRTGRAVRVAEHGQRPEPGDVLLAGTNDHLVLSKGRTLEYQTEPRDVFFRPSVDVFFESVAEHWPQTGVALLLTGMGKDGARGLLKLRSRGWHTVAQDQATSVVWSMPKAAIDAGAACETLAIDLMPRAVAARLGA